MNHSGNTNKSPKSNKYPKKQNIFKYIYIYILFCFHIFYNILYVLYIVYFIYIYYIFCIFCVYSHNFVFLRLEMRIPLPGTPACCVRILLIPVFYCQHRPQKTRLCTKSVAAATKKTKLCGKTYAQIMIQIVPQI